MIITEPILHLFMGGLIPTLITFFIVCDVLLFFTVCLLVVIIFRIDSIMTSMFSDMKHKTDSAG